MSRKIWAIFILSQIIGISLCLYSLRFEEGVGGVREYLWIPAMLVLLPGILFGFVADALDIGIFSRWYGLPFLAVVVLLNTGFWNAVILLIKRSRRSLKV